MSALHTNFTRICWCYTRGSRARKNFPCDCVEYLIVYITIVHRRFTATITVFDIAKLQSISNEWYVWIVSDMDFLLETKSLIQLSWITIDHRQLLFKQMKQLSAASLVPLLYLRIPHWPKMQLISNEFCKGLGWIVSNCFIVKNEVVDPAIMNHQLAPSTFYLIKWSSCPQRHLCNYLTWWDRIDRNCN